MTNKQPFMDDETAAQLFDLVQDMQKEMRESGRKEYAVTDNTLANFTLISTVAKALGLDLSSAFGVGVVYFLKHFLGFISYANGQEVHRDSLEGRLVDMQNYLFLMYCMLKTERHEDG